VILYPVVVVWDTPFACLCLWWRQVSHVHGAALYTGVAGTDHPFDLTEETADYTGRQRVVFHSCAAFPPIDASESFTFQRWEEETASVWGDLQTASERLSSNAIVFDNGEVANDCTTLHLSLHSVKYVLGGRAWVDDLVVDQGLRLVTRAHPFTRFEDGLCKFACIPHFTLHLKRSKGELHLSKTLQRELVSAQHVFCALHTPGHWSLVYVDIAGRKMHRFDTMASSASTLHASIGTFHVAAMHVAGILRHHGLDVGDKEWSCGVVQPAGFERVRMVSSCSRVNVSKDFKCPIQSDTYNCGMYVCAIAECLAWGKDPLVVGSMNMDVYRMHLMWMMWHWNTHRKMPKWSSNFCFRPHVV
jgi:hypothetical protein